MMKCALCSECLLIVPCQQKCDRNLIGNISGYIMWWQTYTVSLFLCRPIFILHHLLIINIFTGWVCSDLHLFYKSEHQSGLDTQMRLHHPHPLLPLLHLLLLLLWMKQSDDFSASHGMFMLIREQRLSNFRFVSSCRRSVSVWLNRSRVVFGPAPGSGPGNMEVFIVQYWKSKHQESTSRFSHQRNLSLSNTVREKK